MKRKLYCALIFFSASISSLAKLVVDDEPPSDSHYLPILDFEMFLHGDETARKEFSVGLDSAMRRPGFYYLINSGVSADLIDAALKDTSAFFDQPLEEKMKYHNPRDGREWDGGYAAFREERLYGIFADEKELFDFFMKAGSGRNHETLAEHPFWGNTVLPELARQCETLVEQLFKAYDYASGTDFLYKKHIGPMKYRDFRFTHYPPFQEDAVGMKCGPHTDYGSFTMLMQDDVGGLEVFNLEHNSWEPATPIRGAIVVNTANALQRWSNDQYISTMHQVVPSSDPTVTRHSIGYFVGPNWDAVLDNSDYGIPLSEQKYKPVSFAQHFMNQVNKMQDATSDTFYGEDYGSQESVDPVVG